MSEDEVLIEITLPVIAWRIVMAHVERGAYSDVSCVIGVMTQQLTEQLEAARLARALEQQKAAAAAPVELGAPPEKAVH
jgi:hypothetical protein